VRGGADLCVVIRSAFLRDGRAYLHAGGGVVADSRSFAEHAEAETKLAPLLRALAEAEGVAGTGPSRPSE
jgi:anthranilate synthase component 1